MAPVALHVLLVERRGGRVGLRRGAVVAGAHPDVRGHVHEMPGARHERLEPLRAGDRALRRARRFDGVNVIVIRARMIRVALHHAFERRDDLARCPARDRHRSV